MTLAWERIQRDPSQLARLQALAKRQSAQLESARKVAELPASVLREFFE